MSVLERGVESQEAAANEREVPSVYLMPGQIFTSSRPAIVTTILGSCVAVCLWDAGARIGGMNHFLLAANPMRDGDDARYGNVAMPQLVAEMIERGASPNRLLAKIVGGASVLETLGSLRRSIGEQNLASAKAFLEKSAIRIGGVQGGGRRGRKLLFHTGNGSAYVKEI